MPFKHGVDSDEDDDDNAAEEEQEDVPALDEAEEDDHVAEEEAADGGDDDDEPSSSSAVRKQKGSSNKEEDDGDELASGRRGGASYIPSSVVPSSLRGLRACLLCALVKTAEQFETSGCDNCERFLQLRGNRHAVLECTSSSFDGLVMMMSPSESWVAKWLRWDRGCVPGAYAVSVTGQLPPEIISELEENGYRYVSRDTSLRA